MIGIDIVNIPRLKDRPEGFYTMMFSDKERAEAATGNYYTKLAGKWAAKEAAYKAGVNALVNSELEILTHKKRPCIFVKGKRKKYCVSISHEQEYAVAAVFKK
jgi:phosphopantetheine--protein transferase-like protein